MKQSRLDRMNPDNTTEEKRELSREESIIDGVELNRDSCSFILEQDSELLKHRYDIDSKAGLQGIDELDLFLKYGALSRDIPFYLVIHKIDQSDEQTQADFFSLTKDRTLISKPAVLDDIIIVFTISSIERAKNVLYNLWNYGAHLIEV